MRIKLLSLLLGLCIVSGIFSATVCAAAAEDKHCSFGGYLCSAEPTQETLMENTILSKLRPATGDDSAMGTWIAVLCISGAVLLAAAGVLLLVLRKKR